MSITRLTPARHTRGQPNPAGQPTRTASLNPPIQARIRQRPCREYRSSVTLLESSASRSSPDLWGCPLRPHHITRRLDDLHRQWFLLVPRVPSWNHPNTRRPSSPSNGSNGRIWRKRMGYNCLLPSTATTKQALRTNRTDRELYES